MLSLRKPSKPIPELEELVDVVFPGQQEPECSKKYDHEEFHRLWSVQTERGPRPGIPGAGGPGRGRGRGRPMEGGALEGGEQQGGGAPSWGRETAEWDDGAKASNGLDLADFSAASLKFSSEMGTGETGLKVDLYGANDALDGLYQEQQKSRSSQKIEDDDDIPSWAQDSLPADVSDSVFGLAPARPSAAAPAPRTNDEGRSILNALLSNNAPSTVSFESSLKVETSGVGLALNMLSFKEDPVLVQNDRHQLLGGLGVSAHSQAPVSQASMLLPPALQPFHQIVVPDYTLDDSVWLYLDPRGRIQGLFSTTSMHQWMMDGYFAPTLPIKLEHWTSFHPLYTVFSDPQSAFQSIPREPGMAPITSMMQQMNATPSYASVSAAPAKPQQAPVANLAPVAPIVPVAPAPVIPAPVPVPVAPVDTPKVVPAPAAEPAIKPAVPQPKAQEKEKKADKVAQKEKEVVRAAPAVPAADEKPVTPVPSSASQAPAPAPKKETKAAPWSKPVTPTSSADSAKSLAAIQAEEAERAKKQEAEAAAQTKIKSSQLKSALGLPASPSNKGGAVWGSAPAAPAASSGSLKEIQEQEEKRRLAEESVKKQSTAAALATAVATAPKWAGAAAPASQAKSASSQSLAEIMELEKAQSQSQGATSVATSSAPAASSWAAKAAKVATSTGSYNALAASAPLKPVPIKTSTPAPVAVVAPAAAPKRPGQEVESFWNFSDQKPAAAAPAAAPAESKSAKPTTPKASSDGMPAAVAEWCREQLRKMNQSDDLSLIQVCYSMQSAVDIREYLADYLGSTPQVSLFATEFIKRKSFPSGQPAPAATANPNVPQSGGGAVNASAAAKAKKKPAGKK